MLDKSVADTFSHAASLYKQHDVLQRITAKTLQGNAILTGHLADIGCGPGTCFSDFSSVSNVIAIDIAAGMLEQVRLNYPQYSTLNCDAQSLTLSANSVDSVYSNLALQWCDDFPKAVNEIERVLVDNGVCSLAIVADGSLPELQTLGFRTNQFTSMPSLLSAFGVKDVSMQSCNSHWTVLQAKVEKVTVYFADLRSLLYSIKGVGASAGQAGSQSRAMLSKSAWQERVVLAQGLATEKGIPLTYHIAYIHAKKR